MQRQGKTPGLLQAYVAPGRTGGQKCGQVLFRGRQIEIPGTSGPVKCRGADRGQVKTVRIARHGQPETGRDDTFPFTS